MTLVGKIMAFFVLVFCLVAGGLMITVYATRANWADGHKKALEQLEVARRDRDQYAAEREQFRKEREDSEKNLKAQIAAETIKVDAANKALAKEKAAKEALEGTLRAQAAAIEKTQASSGSRGNEVAILQKQLADLNLIVRGQVEEIDKERDERVRAEIERKTYQNRNLELELQLRDMAKDLARAKTTGTTGVTARKPGQGNPPPDNVEGKIRSMDPNGSLLTITVGSDAGLAEGHTLEVFRLGATPKYLGTIEILSVRPHEAVARPLKKGMPVQVNDRVATKIQVGGGS